MHNEVYIIYIYIYIYIYTHTLSLLKLQLNLKTLVKIHTCYGKFIRCTQNQSSTSKTDKSTWKEKPNN